MREQATKRFILGPQTRALTPDGWLAFVHGARAIDWARRERMEMHFGRIDEAWFVVERASETIRYQSDRMTHGVNERWSFPKRVRKILGSGFVLAGDCEDIALWMRRELVYLYDWPRSALRLCYCKKPHSIYHRGATHQIDPIDHIVLIAQTDLGDFVLEKGRVVTCENAGLEFKSLENWPYWNAILQVS